MGDGSSPATRKRLRGLDMMSSAFAVLVVATVLLLTRSAARAANRGCRYRCTCVADSAALGALGSVVEDPPSGHGR